jgi:dTDP-4-dehydrorhamnose 3,5-epimerase
MPRSSSFYDVIVDLRPESASFMKWTAVELTQENLRLLYIPKGLAHGYITLVEASEVHYQVSELYHPQSASGVRWDDPAFKIDWPMPPSIIAPRDARWPLMRERPR